MPISAARMPTRLNHCEPILLSRERLSSGVGGTEKPKSGRAAGVSAMAGGCTTSCSISDAGREVGGIAGLAVSQYMADRSYVCW
jgi:hypothetical protein